jgi:selenocysteine-specific elongation factor
MARVLPVDRSELEPGGIGPARFRLEAPVVALPGDRFVVRSYSPIVTIGGGTVLDIAPPRFKRKGPALAAHLALLADGDPPAVLEEHLKQAGAAGARVGDLRARTPFGPEQLRRLLDRLQQDGRTATPASGCAPRPSVSSRPSTARTRSGAGSPARSCAAGSGMPRSGSSPSS